MMIKKKLKIIVAEPWNFKSSDGDNLFYCTIVDINRTDKSEIYLARTKSDFLINNRKVDFVILHKRDYQNNKNYNIYIFKSSYDINLFSCDKNIGEQLDFKMIGTVDRIL